MTREITFSTEEKFAAFKCDNCDMTFLIFAVLERENEYLEKESVFMSQVRHIHCPHCGVKS